MSVFLGIDFGSRTCRTAVLRNGALDLVSNRFSERGLPVVSRSSAGPDLQNGELPFVFRSLKQDLGSTEFIRTTTGVHSLADQISSVLHQVHEDVVGHIGEKVTGVVVGIPGFFPDSPRAALRDGALGAGFDAVRLLDEGLALVLGAAPVIERRTVVVYALGAGVFSATVIIVENGRPRVLSTDGDRLLGGTDFDGKLASLILARLEYGADSCDAVSVLRLKELSERVKIGLSRREEEVFDVNRAELFGQGGVVRLVIRRTEFEGAISRSIDKTIELTKKAIASAGLAPSQIDELVMAGASTCIPLVERRLSAEFAVQRVRAGNADVARGAARFGQQIGAENWKRREVSSPIAAPTERKSSPRPTPERSEVRGPESGTWAALFSPQLLEAETHWASGDLSGSIQIFEAMMDEARAYLGTLYHAQGQRLFGDRKYGEAIVALEKAAQHTPSGDDRKRVMQNYHESLNHLAAQLLQGGRWDEARITIRQALEINSECKGCRELQTRILQELKVSVPRGGRKKKRK